MIPLHMHNGSIIMDKGLDGRTLYVGYHTITNTLSPAYEFASLAIIWLIGMG